MVTLAEDGMTMLCVTHEMWFARQVADRVVFMDAGQIVEVNDPVGFFSNPRHERAKLFLRHPGLICLVLTGLFPCDVRKLG
jgi:general L-amino acid transport system ATP-binding protein